MAHAATLSRSQTVQNLVQHAFGVTYSHLSELQGRTVEDYCKDVAVPKYISKFFNPQEKEVIGSATPVEEYDVKLSYKLLKTCCGLKPHNHETWGSEKANDTFEFLITFCWTEYLSLCEASAMRDDNLNSNMDKILEALLLLIEKVEKKKSVDETSLKSELIKHIGEELESYDSGILSQHIHTILCQHAVHQMFVMVYIHLNHLNGMSLSNYLNHKKINLMPRTLFSNERKFLEGNPHPREMPLGILYRVVKRVCFSFDIRRRDCQDHLESTLHDLRKEYITPLRKEEQYTEKCMKIFMLLDKTLEELCQRTNKDRRLIIGNLTQEPFVVESLFTPFELPTSTKVVPSLQSSQSLEGSPASPKIPRISAPLLPPPQSVTLATSVADSLSVEEMNICVLFRVMRPGGVIARTLALVFDALHGDIESIKNRKIWRNVFTSDEKTFLQNLSDKSKYRELSQRDITLLCKLLRNSCPLLSTNDDIWMTSNDTLEYHITFIKKERNKLAHEVSSIKTEDLKNTLEIIKNVLYRILERTESRLKDNEHSMKESLKKQRYEVNDEMQRILQISQTLPYDYLADIKRMVNKVKTAAQQELNQPHLYRENLQFLSPISGSSDSRHKSLTINEVFVERELEDKDDFKAESTYKIEDVLFCQDTTLASYRAFIVHGRPGEGKTSICKYAFHLWSRNIQESSAKGVDLLVYIPCSYVTSKSLATYLKGKLPQTLAGTKNDDIIPLLQEPQVLFLIDGYDKAGEEAKSLIDEILTSLPDSRVIFTTKTQWMPKLLDRVKSVTSCYKVLSMVEITEEKRYLFIRKIFNAMGQKTEDCNKFLTYLHEMRENLKTLIHLPLTLSLLALLWIEEPGNAKKTRTLPQLYHKLIDLILKRVTKQLGKNDSFFCREWMITLGKLAWDNLKKNKHFISEDDQMPLKRKAQELGLGVEGNNHLVSSLLYCKIHDNLIGSEKSWTFTFTSQQEYFAAEYIVDALGKDKTAALKNILELRNEEEDKYRKRLQRLVPVLEFICGLLVIRDGMTEARLEEITEIMSVKEPWSFAALEKMFGYFMVENVEMQLIVKKMFVCEKMDVFEGFEPQSTLWVLKKTSLVLQRDVTVASSVSDLQQLKPLLDYLLSKLHNVSLLVNVDKVSFISSAAKFTEKEIYKTMKIIFKAWKPLCISEVIMEWPYSRPLHFHLHPEFFPLVWWEALLCLFTLERPVTKLVCNPDCEKLSQIVSDGSDRLGVPLIRDKSLPPTEIIIHPAPKKTVD